jgi:hypothetical protein
MHLTALHAAGDRQGVMCQESSRSWRLKGIGLRWSGCSHQQTFKRDAPSIILKISARKSS